MSVAAVVLAAGASSRMGHPKATIPWRGRPFVEHCVALASGCAPIVVVQGATRLPALEATVVENPDWQTGALSSLQAGLGVLDLATCTGVLVLSVDRPHLAPSTIAALLHRHRSDPLAVLQPSHRGDRGHPILHPRDVAEALLAVPPDGTPRDVVRRPDIAARRTFVPVEDAAILDNIDTPDALRRLLSNEAE